MNKRKVTIGITEVQYRTETQEVKVPDEIKDDDVCEWLCDHVYGFECSEDAEWESWDGYDEDDIPGVDSDRYDVYRNGKQVTGGHL